MTYQEIKDRLSKCELALSKIKDGTYNSTTIQDLEATREKLEVLKESYLKLLKEEDDMEPGFVATADEDKAADLAKDGVKVKLTSEQEGVEFSAQEMKAIAKKTGEALIKALRNAGDEIDTIKAHSFDINTFDIYVKYKNDFEDEFTFDVRDDRLHLVDFSFDKELVDVGVKPSGEAILHVDHLANELKKNFTSLSEGMSDQEYADAKEKERLDNHPERDMIKKIQALIQNANKNEGEYAADKHNVNVYGYQTMHFDICPGAKALFDRVIKDGSIKDKEGLKRLAELHDILFTIEKIALKDSNRAKQLLDRAIKVASNIYVVGNRIGLDQNTDLSYIQGHIEKINDAARGEEVNEDINLHKIEVSVRDAKKAQDIMYDMYDRQFEQNGSNVYLFDDEQTAYDAMMDLTSRGIEVENIEDFDDEEEFETDYMKRRKAEKDYQQENALGFSDIEKLGSKAASDIDISVRRDPNYTFGKRPGDDARLRYKYAKQLGYLEENEAEDQGGDLDIGHQDDEPDMLKQYAYDIATYAAKLYKQLDKYDKMDAEVDFPNWWQSKVILAKDYISKAQHYLEFEEKQPAIDQLALEENVDKVAGGIPYKVEGGKAIITQPLDDSTKKRIIVRAKEHGYHAAPNQAGGITINLKKGTYENASAEEEEKFHKELDKLVHKTFGKRKEELEEKESISTHDETLAKAILDIVDMHAATAGLTDDEAAKEVIEFIGKQFGHNSLEEATDLYDRNGIQITRFSGGSRGLMVQINYGGKYIHVPVGEYPFLVRAMQSVQDDLKDLSRQMPRAKNMDELFGSKGVSNYDELIGPIEKGFAYLKKYVSKKEPDAMPDLQKAIDFFDIFDEKMSYGIHMELEEGQAAIKKQLDKIDQALKQHKDTTIAIVRKDINQRTEDEKAHLAKMADLTKKKKELLDKYGDAVAGINRNQELD